MLGFIHHRSTGDMLAEFATGGGNKKRAKSIDESLDPSTAVTVNKGAKKYSRQKQTHRRPQVYTSLQVNEDKDDDGDDYYKKDEEEGEEEDEDEDELSARQRPLLQVTDGEAARWSSTKHLEDDDRLCTRQQVAVGPTTKRWLLERQFRSIGDFLAVSTTSHDQQQQQHLEDTKDRCALHEMPAQVEDNEPSSSPPPPRYTVNRNAATTLRRSQLLLPKLRANGAQKRRRRVATCNSDARHLASLSLSSPMLSHWQWAEMNGQVDNKAAMPFAQDTRHKPSQTKLAIKDQDQDDEDQVDARETKVEVDRFQCIVVADAVEEQQDNHLAHSTLSSDGSSGCYSTCNEDASFADLDERGDTLGQVSGSVSVCNDNHLSNQRADEKAYCCGYILPAAAAVAGATIKPSQSSCSINIMPISDQQALGHRQQDTGHRRGSERANNVVDGRSGSNNNNDNNSDNSPVQHVATAQQVVAAAAANKVVSLAAQVHTAHSSQIVDTSSSDQQTGGQYAGTTQNTTGSLMVDLNCIASKLMGSPGQSLRQALQPSHSGIYKVSREQLSQVSISGSTGEQVQQHQLQQQQQRQEQEKQENSTVQHREGNKNARESRENNRRIARLSRPGRSPVSLQRQTNARLTKHRLRIQQQRQEQLAQLAQRERQRQPDRCSNSNSTQYRQRTSTPLSSEFNNNTDRVAAIDCCLEFPDTTPTTTRTRQPQVSATSLFQESVQLINGLRDRLSLSNININNKYNLASQLPNQSNDHNQTNQSPPTTLTTFHQYQDRPVLSNSRLAQHRRQRGHHLHLSLNNNNSYRQPQPHQVITPTTSRAIEICDNQLACSSRQDRLANDLQQQQQVAGNFKHAVSPGGKVIEYNPINMLRPVTLNQQQYRNHQHSQPQSAATAGSRKYTNRGHCQDGTKCDEVIGSEEEDRQTIASSNGSSLSLNKPFCKICHIGSSKNGDKLISPCRCAGTMQYIHCGCLLKWLEISNRTNEKPMSCELCAHEYTWHKKFNYRQVRTPKCSVKDVFLHIIFIAAVGVMFMSALAPMLHKRSSSTSSAVATTSSSLQPPLAGSPHKTQASGYDSSGGANEITSGGGRNNRHHMSVPLHHSFNGQTNHLATGGRLASDEKFMLLCAATFFISFFLAIYVQTKARDTLYSLFVKFLAMNQTFYITEYDHGQLSGSSANNHNNNSNNISGASSGGANNNSDSNIKHQYQQHQQQQQQQQQQFCSVNSRSDRKSSVKS